MNFLSCENQMFKNLLSVLKFAKTQNEPKRAETKQCNAQLTQQFTTSFSLPCPQPGRF